MKKLVSLMLVLCMMVSVLAVATAEDKIIINLTRCTFNLATPDSEQVKKVEDAINAYLAENGKNYEIRLTDIGSGEYTDKANLALANNALAELEDLHSTLLNEDAMYRAAILRLQPSLNLLKAKTDRPTMSDIEACLLLLYQIMLLHLQKREITPQTADVQQRATQLLQFLSKTYYANSRTL